MAIAERNGATKLTRPQVDAVREYLSAGVAARALARVLGVNESTIRHIKHGRTWK
jgi:hypothetical protein